MMRRWLFLCSLPLWLLDQATKAAVVARFPTPSGADPSGRIEVIPGFFHLVRVHNRGMAFGVGNGSPWANVLFVSVAAAAVGLIIALWRKNVFADRLSRLSASLLLAGILGNVTDRVFRGYVVDFLEFNLRFMVWPSFNVADSCICVAAGLLLLSSFRGEPAKA